jgi:ribosomal protein S18 acetylase RimI-like enzyme
MIGYIFVTTKTANFVDFTDLEKINNLLQQLSASIKPIDGSYFSKVCSQNRVLFAYDMEIDRTKRSYLVGMAILVPQYIFAGPEGHIHDVVVDKEYRGRKIGEELALRLIYEAKKLGLRHVDLTSNPSREVANALYQKIGFKFRKTNCYRFPLT